MSRGERKSFCRGKIFGWLGWQTQIQKIQGSKRYKRHQAIADQINLIREELEEKEPDATLIYDSLRVLLEMTRDHFKHEEDQMVIDSYPGMLLHKRDHDYLVSGLRDFNAGLVDKTFTLSPSLADELTSWVRLHIKRFDNAYQDYVKRIRQPE